MSVEQFDTLLERGRGFMPSFAKLSEGEKCALMTSVLGTACRAQGSAAEPSILRQAPSPYEFVGYEKWSDARGLPAIKPPWGTLSAIDLNTGDYVWRIPLGEHPALAGRVGPASGTEQYGGPIVTAGGLVLIA